MEENSMTMQTLVIAHAAFGHNHFFKNNYLFRQWTDADGILDYLDFARTTSPNARKGTAGAVERVLDAAHALKEQAVNRYPALESRNLAPRKSAPRERRAHAERAYNDLWRTVPAAQDEERRDAEHRAAAASSARPAGGEPALFPREDSPAAANIGSARSSASCATWRSISIRSSRRR